MPGPNLDVAYNPPSEPVPGLPYVQPARRWPSGPVTPGSGVTYPPYVGPGGAIQPARGAPPLPPTQPGGGPFSFLSSLFGGGGPSPYGQGMSGMLDRSQMNPNMAGRS